jgi:hypothetical protein
MSPIRMLYTLPLRDHPNPSANNITNVKPSYQTTAPHCKFPSEGFVYL